MLKRKAVALLSGGLDSMTSTAIALSDGFDVYAMTFEYGQRHKVEICAARQVAKTLAVTEHRVLRIDLGELGGSALTADIAVPKHRNVSEMSVGIPVTYVPARNTIFLAFALAWCEVLNASDIFIGVNALDYSGYPDCRPEFIDAFERMAALATKASVESRKAISVHTPLIRMTKAEIIRRGLDLGLDYSDTLTCYDPCPNGGACGHCDSCLLRLKGFAELGVADPAKYNGKVAGL